MTWVQAGCVRAGIHPLVMGVGCEASWRRIMENVPRHRALPVELFRNYTLVSIYSSQICALFRCSRGILELQCAIGYILVDLLKKAPS